VFLLCLRYRSYDQHYNNTTIFAIFIAVSPLSG